MLRPVALAAFLILAACHDDGDPPPSIRITALSWGRLVDVYGWRTVGDTRAPERVETDVVVGPLAGEPGIDAPGFHRWLPRDPQTLHPRLLLDAEVGSPDFATLHARLGQDLPTLGDAVVARDAAIVVELSRNAGLRSDFFFLHAPDGSIVGPGNLEAVQLLQLPDPDAPANPLPVRIVARGSRLILDPLLPADEAVAWGMHPTPGLPRPEPGSDRAHLRVAIAIEGPSAIPGLSPDGANVETSSGRRAVGVDFRAAHDQEDALFVRRGHLPDSAAPRLLGEVPMVIAAVDPPFAGRQRVRLFKNGAVHELDAGDVLRTRGFDGHRLEPTEILLEPTDDLGHPAVAFVDVLVRAVDGMTELDSRGRADRPSDPSALAAWLAANGPRTSLRVPFDGTRRRRAPDDPRWFVHFSPTPEPLADGSPSPPDQNLSPFVEATIRFDEPVDLATVRPHDSFLIALRDVFDEAALVADLVTSRGIDPETVPIAKLVTPFLVASRVVDVRGDRTTFRLSPMRGLYLDERMRSEDGPRAFANQRFRYFVHVQAGAAGIRDLGGTSVDLGEDVSHLVLPFALDLRRGRDGPRQLDNLVAHVVRRFDHRDEDERPSVLRDDEVTPLGAPTPIDALAIEDWFGPHGIHEGLLVPRATARMTRFVDDLNQPPTPPTGARVSYCPEHLAGYSTHSDGSARIAFDAPISNPRNPAGSRLQTVWREIDLGLSHDDPADMDLDVEAMAWAPFGTDPLNFDVLHGVSLYLGHSEYRPEPCVGSFLSLPELPWSGLKSYFAFNYAHDVDPTRGQPILTTPHRAFADRDWNVDPGRAFFEPYGVHRYLPLPEFEEPYFTWRDRTLDVQGGNSERGSDLLNTNQNLVPYLLSPFLGGRAQLWTGPASARVVEDGRWLNTQNYQLTSPVRLDTFTGGLVGAIALPLLADFQIDGRANQATPAANGTGPGGLDGGQYRGPGDVAFGHLGWAISLGVTSSPQPNFRAYSSGFVGTSMLPPTVLGPDDPAWQRAAGGYSPTGGRLAPSDNSVFWAAITFLKRRTVLTSGFLDLLDPHRADPAVLDDPRLVRTASIPSGYGADVDWTLDLPGGVRPDRGASIDVEFRLAGEVDPEPWIWTQWQWGPELRPTAANFPLDPRKAGDAGIRKFDDRPTATGMPRNSWVFPYNRVVTAYDPDPGRARDARWLAEQVGPNEEFRPHDVRYLGWRLVIHNGEGAGGPVEPRVDTFALAYRIERLR